VHLLFAPRRSLKALLLRNLPTFPILIDYRLAKWTKRDVSRVLAALKLRGRVRGISLRTKSESYPDMAQIFSALSHAPKLESLEIDPFHDHEYVIFPDTFHLGSTSCLRRLKLRNVQPRCISPLLSTVTGLVELALNLKVLHNTLPEESLLADLKRMSCLRRLELRLTYLPWHHGILSNSPRPPAFTGDIVPLPNLMQFVFTGPHIYLEALAVVLTAPSLQHLDTEVTDEPDSFPLPQLCRFICNTDNQFNLVRLDLSTSQLRFTAETRSKSVYAQTFRIIVPRHIWSGEIGIRLSGPLATVEELVIVWSTARDRRGIQWGGFFNHLPQVKVLQVPWQLALGVAHSFQQDGQEPTMDLLPALEQVNMDMDMTQFLPPSLRRNSQDQVTNAFKSLIAARKKVGRSIMLSFM
jgi:hypothetical protein